MLEKCLLTIFTPAYNRGHTLPRTYKSLTDQSCKAFIWLIVDDGSTDNTAELVREWQQEDNGFEIQYIYTKAVPYGSNDQHQSGCPGIGKPVHRNIDQTDFHQPCIDQPKIIKQVGKDQSGDRNADHAGQIKRGPEKTCPF